jgi:hypothetical protein
LPLGKDVESAVVISRIKGGISSCCVGAAPAGTTPIILTTMTSVDNEVRTFRHCMVALLKLLLIRFFWTNG